MLKELKEKRAKLEAQLVEMRENLDKKNAPMTAEERAAWDNLVSDHADVCREIEKEERRATTERLLAVEDPKERHEERTDERQMEIFRSILRDGVSVLSGLTREERESITGQNGNYLIPTKIADRVEKALLSSGGLFSVADVIRTRSGETINYPTLNDTARKAKIVAEYAKGERGTLQFNNVQLKAFTYRSDLIPISYELLQDSQFDIEGLVVEAIADSLYRGMNDHFTNGAAAATTTPRGIVAAAEAATVGSTDITGDVLLDVMAKAGTAYWRNAQFMFNSKTLVALMKMKDSDGRYIWQPDMINGAAPTIFGHRYVLNEYMDDIEAGKSPILFGDFKKYKIRLVRGVQYRRLEELLAEYGAIGIFAFARADGALIDAGTHPVAKLTISA